MLPIKTAAEIFDREETTLFSPELLSGASAIVEGVRTGGVAALEEYAKKFDGWSPAQPLLFDQQVCADALHRLSPDKRELLERLAARIAHFAQAQLDSIHSMECAIPGGKAGHTIRPLRTAGCYVPGGRYPLVSSLLMSAVTARTAGVAEIWLACPAPQELILAAAAIAGVRGVLVAGGAHAIAAMAFGVGLARCDVIVGPGNQWVTAAKYLVSAHVRIDMLAGPTELLIVADDLADVSLIAADLLAQAEHDVDARPMLIAPSVDFVERVRLEISRQLNALSTRDVASVAMQQGIAVVATDDDEVVALCDAMAPEHLELHVRQPEVLAARVACCGCVFVGAQSAEVLGDYGAGPNHVLPTAGTARFASGLSVESFLRRQTWLRIDDSTEARTLVMDATNLAICEGLSGHAASARRRLVFPKGSSCV